MLLINLTLNDGEDIFSRLLLVFYDLVVCNFFGHVSVDFYRRNFYMFCGDSPIRECCGLNVLSRSDKACDKINLAAACEKVRFLGS